MTSLRHNSDPQAAYLDAAERFRGTVDFVALIDIDEFLCVDGGLDVSGTLDGFGAGVGAIACQQVLFGSSGAEAPTDEPVIARFTRSSCCSSREMRMASLYPPLIS